MPTALLVVLAAILVLFAAWAWRLRDRFADAAAGFQPGDLARFWMWAGVGVLAMFGSFSFGGGAVVWALVTAFIGLLAARRVTPRRAAIAIAAGFAAPILLVVVNRGWPLAVGMLVALAVTLVHSRRDAIVLTVALAVAIGAVLAIEHENVLMALAVGPALLILVALTTGRPQREAAGALTGAGLALFAFGAPMPGISLTLAGAVLMLALGLRRRRLAAVSA